MELGTCLWRELVFLPVDGGGLMWAAKALWIPMLCLEGPASHLSLPHKCSVPVTQTAHEYKQYCLLEFLLHCWRCTNIYLHLHQIPFTCHPIYKDFTPSKKQKNQKQTNKQNIYIAICVCVWLDTLWHILQIFTYYKDILFRMHLFILYYSIFTLSVSDF